MIELLSMLAAVPVSALPPAAVAAAAAPPVAGPELRATGAACQLAGADRDDPAGGRLGDELVRSSSARWRIFGRAGREADEFESRFWSGAEMTALYRAATDRNRVVVGMEAIFEAGFREFARLRQQHKALDARTQLEGAQRAMRATLAREVDRLEHNLELLANVGSTAPYVGLVGTVFGIMVSFHGLATQQAGHHRRGRAGHLRGADRHRDGPVRRHSRRSGPTTASPPASSACRCATKASPRNSAPSCSASRTSKSQ